MRFLVITNSAQFFGEIHSICRRMHRGLRVEHCSTEFWTHSPQEYVQPENVMLVDGSSGGLGQLGKIHKNAFALLGTVCQNKASLTQWTPVSRSDLILWLRESSPMATELSIVEEVAFQSPHVRLAQFRIPTCCKLIPVLRDRIMQGLKDYHVVAGTRENHFCMALEEALNNAFYHGNLEISSELKEDGSSRFIELAAEREQLSPWCRRYLNVTELVSAFGMWLTIQDEGSGFNVQEALARCNDPEAMFASGRGLLLMRAFSDELFFNSNGNEVTLVVYAEGQDRELPLGTTSSSDAERRLVFA